jgi:hypothetical protein
MRFLTSDECVEWCHELGNPTPTELRTTSSSGIYTTTDFGIPADTGRRVALCRLLWNLDQHLEREDTLLWITEWGVWSSCEHMPLFVKWRAAFGESRPLAETPGHVIQRRDEADGLSALIVACLFSWDCWVYSDSRTIIRLSHDEVGTLYEPVARVVSNRRMALAEFGAFTGGR